MSRIWKLLTSPTAIHIAVAVLTVIVERLSRKVTAHTYRDASTYQEW